MENASQLDAMRSGAQALGHQVGQLGGSLDEFRTEDVARDSITQFVCSAQDVFGFLEGDGIVSQFNAWLTCYRVSVE